MSQSSCSREVEVVKALRTGMWEDGLSGHVVGCATCKEIVQMSQYMQALGQRPGKDLALPDASLVWWGAQLLEKQSKVEKAQEFLEWVELISATVIAAGLAGWIGWNWYSIQSMFTSLLTQSWARLWIDAASAATTTPNMFSLGAVILSVVAIALGYPLLVRD